MIRDTFVVVFSALYSSYTCQQSADLLINFIRI